MKFSLTKLKKAFLKPENKEDQKDETYTNNIIKSIEQKPFAVSNANVCYASINELAGYYFLQTFIVGKFKLKTFNGAQLKVLGQEFELELKSDMMELESELFNVPKSYMTRIDFVLDKKDILKMDRSHINSLRLSAKKQSVEFYVMQSIEEQIGEKE